MAYSVTLYYDTGFNLENSPDSSAMLVNMISREYDAVKLRQNNDILRIRIAAEWDDIKYMDYAKIGDVCYFITAVSMVADKTAELNLQLDSIGTIGIDGLRVLDGWCRRRIIPLADQSLDSYEGDVLSEPWSPTRDLVLDAQRGIQPQGEDTTPWAVLLSTGDLLGLKKVADWYTYTPATDDSTEAGPEPAADSEPTEPETGTQPEAQGVAVPKIDPVVDKVQYTLVYNGETIGKYMMPNAGAFDSTNDKIVTSIADVRSLGIESIFISSYLIPLNWINTEQSVKSVNGEITRLCNNSGYITTKFNYKYLEGIENAKVFTLYNNFTIVSEASGNTQDYSFSQVFHQGDTAFQVSLWADLSPSGATFCRPRYYYDDESNLFVGYVRGAGWQNNEIAYTDPSGYRKTTADTLRSMRQAQERFEFDKAGGAIQATKGMAKVFSKDIAGAAGAVVDYGRYLQQQEMSLRQNFQNTFMNYMSAMTVPPELSFPYNPSIQSYVGNAFTVLRYRLHENDAVRFDRFLHMYGEAVDEMFLENMFHKKQNYDFLQVDGLSVIDPDHPWGARYYTDFGDRFKNGVRIWHVPPNEKYLQIGGNPDA